MLAQVNYLIRSKIDGKYLAAHPEVEGKNKTGYLLIFPEHFEALTYLNTHAQNVANSFTVESIASTQLKSLLQRWGFTGIALVKEPIMPQIQFLSL